MLVTVTRISGQSVSGKARVKGSVNLRKDMWHALRHGIILRDTILRSVHASFFRGTQQIVSVNYLFGRPFIPYNFLKGIFTSNFRDEGNLRPSVFGLIKMSFRVPKKGQPRFSERK